MRAHIAVTDTDESGAPSLVTFAISNLDDIATEKEELNIRLKKAMVRIRALEGVRSEFVRNISHDIRTPLNAIVGYSQLLSMNISTEDEKKEYVDYINDCADMVTMFVDDVLSMSERDDTLPNTAPLSLNSVGRHVVRCTRTILHSDVQMTFDSSLEDSFKVDTDERRLGQILVNLLSNACKNTEVGSIDLKCDMDHKPGFATFTVQDTGCGISAKKARSISEMFSHNLDSAEVNGLGLSICSKLAWKIGARLEFDSTYTSGARFLIHIPIGKQAA